MEGMTDEEKSRIGKKVRGIREGMEEKMGKKARLIEMEGRGRKKRKKRSRIGKRVRRISREIRKGKEQVMRKTSNTKNI